MAETITLPPTIMLPNVSTAVNQTEITSEREELAASIENVPFMVCYMMLGVFGVAGISLVKTLVRRNRSLRSTTNILLAFVAVADLISLISFIPFALFLAFPLPGGT